MHAQTWASASAFGHLQRSRLGNARLAGETGPGLPGVEGGKTETPPTDRNREATPPHPPVNALVPEPCSGKVFRVRRKQKALQQSKAQVKTEGSWQAQVNGRKMGLVKLQLCSHVVQNTESLCETR